MRQKLEHWVPMVLCIALSFISMVACAVSPSGAAGLFSFFGFLWMCFYHMGHVTTNLQREVRELREQVTMLQEKRA